MDITYFLGANSAGGFFSHYGQLRAVSGAMLRILKGGPGCGKSTLMKKVARRAEQLGFRPEAILCSSDPDSLDGVSVPELGYAVVDGTAPHVVEPPLCGCGTGYLDLSAGYRTEGLAGSATALRAIQAAGQACYPAATACLRAAADLEPLAAETGALTADLARELLDRKLPDRGRRGTLRLLFLGGFTPHGHLIRWDTVRALCGRVYLLYDTPERISCFLHRLGGGAAARGWDCIAGDSPLRPGARWEQLLIPELGLAFCAAPEDAPCPLPDVIPLGAPSAGNPGAELRCALYREAAGHLRRAKEYHDLLEAGFAPFVDFSIADRAALDCCAELEVLADRAARG